jgi:hypothetical protein
LVGSGSFSSVVLSPSVVLPSFVSAAIYFIGQLLGRGVDEAILLMAPG